MPPPHEGVKKKFSPNLEMGLEGGKVGKTRKLRGGKKMGRMGGDYGRVHEQAGPVEHLFNPGISNRTAA